MTVAAGDAVLVLANIPKAVPLGGHLSVLNISAPGTPAAGRTNVYVDSTQKILAAKNDAGAISVTVIPQACAGFITGVGADGILTCDTATRQRRVMSA